MPFPKPSLRSLFQEKETPPPPSGQPLGLDSIEGVFKKFSPGEKITHAEAKILNEQGRLFDENSMPRFNAPRSFYQNEARRRVAKWDEQAINIFDATSQITSPIWQPLVPNSPAFTEEQKQNIKANRSLEDLKNKFLWSENTTNVVGQLIKGEINEGDAINALAEEFQNRSMGEQIVGSVVGDPFMAGEAVKAMSFMAGLPPLLGRLNKTKNSVKLPARAKDDDLNMDLGFYQNMKNNAIKIGERWPDNRNLDSIGLFFSEGIVDKFSYVNKVTAQAQRKWQNLHGPDAELPDNLFATMHFSLLNGVPASVNLQIQDAYKAMKTKLDGIDANFVNEYLRVKHLMSVLDIMPEKKIQDGYNTKAQLLEKIFKMQAELGDDFNKVEDAASVVRDVYRDLLIKLDAENMIPKKATDEAFESLSEQLQNMYPWYNPLSYVDDAGNLLQGGMSPAINKAKASNPLKWLTDQSPEDAVLEDPLTLFTKNVFKINNMIAENKAKKSLIKVLEYLGDEIAEGATQLADNIYVAAEVPVGTKQRIAGEGVELAPSIIVAPEKTIGPQIFKKAKPRTDVKNRISYIEYHDPDIAKRKGQGGLKVFEVDDEAYRMNQFIRSMPEGQMDRALRFVQDPFRAAFISLNPRFILNSIIVDSIATAVFNGTLPHKMASNVIEAMYKSMDDLPELREMILNGGDVSGFMTRTAEDKANSQSFNLINKMLEPKVYDADGNVQQFRMATDELGNIIYNNDGTPKLIEILDQNKKPVFGPSTQKPGEVLEINKRNWDLWGSAPNLLESWFNLTHKAELAPRVAVYKGAKEAGFSPERAAYMTREASVDFQRAGLWTRELNKLFMFTAVAVQGSYLPIKKIISPTSTLRTPLTKGEKARRKASQKDPRKAYEVVSKNFEKRASIGIATLLGAAGATYVQNRMFPEYFKLSPEDRAKIGLMFPSKQTDTYGNVEPHFITVTPINRELAIFLAPFTFLLEQIDKNLGYPGLDTPGVPMTAGQVGSTIQGAYNPLTAIFGTGLDREFTGGTALVPTEIGRTIAELNLNLDNFTQRPIIPPEFINLGLEEQYDEYTSRVAKTVGPRIGISPFKIDHMFRVGVFKDLFMAADRIMALGDGEDIQAQGYLERLEEHIRDSDDPKDNINIERIFFNQVLQEDALSQGFNRLDMERRIRQLRLQKEFDAKIPFLSTILDSFVIKKGNALYDQGVIVSEDVTNLSAKHTRAISSIANSWFDAFGTEAMDEADAKLYKYFMNPKEVTYDPSTNNIGTDVSYSANHYLGEIREIKDTFRQFIDVHIQMNYSNNYQGVDSTDPEQYQTWKNNIFTVGGQIEDMRSQSRVLAMGYKSIQINDLPWATQQTGWDSATKDWVRYYNELESYKMDIRTKFGQETLDDVMKVVNENKSSMQLFQEKVFEEMRPYWNIETWVIETIDEAYDGNLLEEYQIYKAMNGTTADVYRADNIERYEAFGAIKSFTDKGRLAFLQGNLIVKNDGTYEENPYIDNMNSNEYKLIQAEAARIEQLLIEWDLKSVGSWKNDLTEGFAQQHVEKFK